MFNLRFLPEYLRVCQTTKELLARDKKRMKSNQKKAKRDKKIKQYRRPAHYQFREASRLMNLRA